MSGPRRRSRGGIIDRGTTLRFVFNGEELTGHPGDTLASALLANGVQLVARSFKYHRPRGIVAAGVDEPNAVVQLGDGPRTVPNLKATEIALHDGLRARSVNAFPSVRRDLGAVAGWMSRLLPAGFQYKMFHRSPWLWRHAAEPAIRRAAGFGRAPRDPDPDAYEHMHVHCDVLVAGGGPAGLAAALAAHAGGARVILADEQERFGGSLLGAPVRIDGGGGIDWAAAALRRLADAPEVRLLPRTTVFGAYDGNYLCALERCTDHDPGAAPAGAPRQCLWHIRARRVVLAAGAHERPLVFAGNDRPGIMLAGAVRTYLHRWGVLPGRRAVVFANNDGAWATALDLRDAGTGIAAIVDTRPGSGEAVRAAAAARDIPVMAGHAVTAARGRSRVTGVTVRAVGTDGRAGGPATRLACDAVAMSGGWNPAVHLFCQAGGTPAWDGTQACFRPGAPVAGQRSAGACNGTFGLAGALAEGAAAGAAAARETGFAAETAVPETDEPDPAPPQPAWLVAEEGSPDRDATRHFVDFQNDTTVADIRLAVREGFEAVEHMKRYTLAGFGTDQGRISNVNALAILAGIVGRPIPEVGTTTFRPPYAPVTFAAMAGRNRGALFEPGRQTAIHDRHVAAGAVFEDVGQWKRPRYFPQGGEDMEAAVLRECRAVRGAVGVMDASTLGKIEVEGRDAAGFLSRVYTGDLRRLAVGRVRYGVMCREDGMVFDDGTTARLDAQRYLMTTTTGGAAPVLEHMEDYLQTEWPHLQVQLTPVTEQWATVALAGPRSRDVLAALAPQPGVTAAELGFMCGAGAVIGGVPARVFRISFTGELQYEINVPWHYGAALWDAVMAAGAPWNIAPYGTETMHVLRAEKGFVIVGQDSDGSQTPDDLGLGRLVSRDGGDFIGRRSLDRPDCRRADRRQLVGLLPERGAAPPPEGTQLVARGSAGAARPVPMAGHITSSYRSAALGRAFCLALVAGGRSRHGEVLEAAAPGGPAAVTVCDPVFYDPKGARRDGD